MEGNEAVKATENGGGKVSSLLDCYVCKSNGSLGVLKRWSNGMYCVACSCCYHSTCDHHTPEEAKSEWEDEQKIVSKYGKRQIYFYFSYDECEIKIISLAQLLELRKNRGSQEYDLMSVQQKVDEITKQDKTPILVYDIPT